MMGYREATVVTGDVVTLRRLFAPVWILAIAILRHPLSLGAIYYDGILKHPYLLIIV
jgi:hypothetical protein